MALDVDRYLHAATEAHFANSVAPPERESVCGCVYVRERGEGEGEVERDGERSEKRERERERFNME
jgi:hypothetical protein